MEIGNDYRKSDWSQKLLNFQTFILEHMLTEKQPVCYLAMHDLTLQFPEILRDFIVPDYVYMILDEDEEPRINFW